jgi:hypothetical protein
VVSGAGARVAEVESMDEFDDEEIEELFEEDEEVVQYEIVLTDFASFNDKWRVHPSISLLENLRSLLVNDLADLRVTQADMLTHSKDKTALDSCLIERAS